MHLNHTVIILLVFASSLLLFGCSPDPQKDIVLFQPFIDANIDKVSDDPYISSTLRPSDKLYDVLVNLQHGRHDKAEARLLELMEQGDIQAQYWYARLIYRSSIKDTSIALSLLKSASDVGNPDALFSLSPWAAQCTVYFGNRNCTEDNFSKAVEVFKERAKQGDLRAQYFLLRMFKPDGSRIRQQYYFTGGAASLDEDSYYLYHSDETRAFFIKEIIRFAEGYYYQPLMDYVNLNLKWDYKSRTYKSPSESHRRLSMQLLEIAANHNYIPALNLLTRLKRETLKKDDVIYQKLKQLGGTNYLASRFYDYLPQYSREEQLCFGLQYEELTGSTKFIYWPDIPPTKEELSSLNCSAKAELSSMQSMIYIDEFTGRNNWVDR